MLYTELLKLWDEAVKAVDGQDWRGALAKLDGIYEPTARTLFVTAAAHLALGQLQAAIKVLKLQSETNAPGSLGLLYSYTARPALSYE